MTTKFWILICVGLLSACSNKVMRNVTSTDETLYPPYELSIHTSIDATDPSEACFYAAEDGMKFKNMNEAIERAKIIIKQKTMKFPVTQTEYCVKKYYGTNKTFPIDEITITGMTSNAVEDVCTLFSHSLTSSYDKILVDSTAECLNKSKDAIERPIKGFNAPYQVLYHAESIPRCFEINNLYTFSNLDEALKVIAGTQPKIPFLRRKDLTNYIQNWCYELYDLRALTVKFTPVKIEIRGTDNYGRIRKCVPYIQKRDSEILDLDQCRNLTKE